MSNAGEEEAVPVSGGPGSSSLAIVRKWVVNYIIDGLLSSFWSGSIGSRRHKMAPYCVDFFLFLKLIGKFKFISDRSKQSIPRT